MLSFTKDLTGWYIDLPEWEGSKEDLAMVSGADTLLDDLSNGNDIVIVEAYLEEQDDSFLHLRKLYDCEYNGADYEVVSTGDKLWLCDVTKFVFGGLPNDIFIRVS